MKYLGIFLLLLTGTLTQAKTVDALLTCEQEEGDQWIEAGIIMNDGPGYTLIVLQHNEDDHSVKLLKSVPVFEKLEGSVTAYVNKADTIKLRVDIKRLRGELSILSDGPSGMYIPRMTCFNRDKLYW